MLARLVSGIDGAISCNVSPAANVVVDENENVADAAQILTGSQVHPEPALPASERIHRRLRRAEFRVQGCRARGLRPSQKEA